jgi:hypothetical protein
MKKATITLAVCLAFASAALTGCVSVHKVTIKDAPRKTVRFESAETMRPFYEAILVKHFPKDGKPSRVRVGNTLYTWETRPSADVVFNDAVTAADTDGDGVISALEAGKYTSHP